MLLDDQFVIAPRGHRSEGPYQGSFTAADAFGAVADLPCPITDSRVQEAVATTCRDLYWPECFMNVALKATRQKGRSAPVLVTWGDLRPFDPDHKLYPLFKASAGIEPLTGLPTGVPTWGVRPNFKFTLGTWS